MSAAQPLTVPRIGMLATVRNRRGLVTSVEAFDAPPEGRLHLVNVEYLDADGAPEDQLLWEREPAATLLEPTALPTVEISGSMALDEFDALVRATRWLLSRPMWTRTAPKAHSTACQ